MGNSLDLNLKEVQPSKCIQFNVHLDMKMKSGGQISDKIILVKRKKLRNVKLKVDSNKFGVKARRSSLERCLICDHDAVQVDTSAGLLGA